MQQYSVSKIHTRTLLSDAAESDVVNTDATVHYRTALELLRQAYSTTTLYDIISMFNQNV